MEIKKLKENHIGKSCVGREKLGPRQVTEGTLPGNSTSFHVVAAPGDIHPPSISISRTHQLTIRNRDRSLLCQCFHFFFLSRGGGGNWLLPGPPPPLLRTIELCSQPPRHASFFFTFFFFRIHSSACSDLDFFSFQSFFFICFFFFHFILVLIGFSTIQQALFGCDIWGRSVALIEFKKK